MRQREEGIMKKSEQDIARRENGNQKRQQETIS